VQNEVHGWYGQVGCRGDQIVNGAASMLVEPIQSNRQFFSRQHRTGARRPTLKVVAHLCGGQFAIVNCQSGDLTTPAVIDRRVSKHEAPRKLSIDDPYIRRRSRQGTVYVKPSVGTVRGDAHKHTLPGAKDIIHLEPWSCDIPPLI